MFFLKYISIYLIITLLYIYCTYIFFYFFPSWSLKFPKPGCGRCSQQWQLINPKVVHFRGAWTNIKYYGYIYICMYRSMNEGIPNDTCKLIHGKYMIVVIASCNYLKYVICEYCERHMCQLCQHINEGSTTFSDLGGHGNLPRKMWKSPIGPIECTSMLNNWEGLLLGLARYWGKTLVVLLQTRYGDNAYSPMDNCGVCCVCLLYNPKSIPKW
jgi:hypothetical protein